MLAERIRQLRLSHQMTQEQAAWALGVSAQSISRWECGNTLPDALMLPHIAKLFKVTLDELYGTGTGCEAQALPQEEREFLLQTYAQMYGPEAGPWNLSPRNYYLQYRFGAFFEKHFAVEAHTDICNIGIGAGEWDHYLSYRLKGGSLTSIDRLEHCCRQLRARLVCEGNPNPVEVLCADAMELELPERFDIVTMVGSTISESGCGLGLLEKALTFVKSGGALYLQTLDAMQDSTAVMQTAFGRGMKLEAYQQDDTYGFCGRYYKFVRP